MGLWRHENIGFEQWCDCGRCGWWQHHDLRCRQTDTGWLCHPASQHKTHWPRSLPWLQQISGKSILIHLSINSYLNIEIPTSRTKILTVKKVCCQTFWTLLNALHVKMDKQWLYVMWKIASRIILLQICNFYPRISTNYKNDRSHKLQWVP